MSSTVAQLYEHSSRDTPEGDADPYLLLLRTLDVHTSDVAYVVMKIREAKSLAENMDYRMIPLLMNDIKGFVEGIVSLSSVNGKGLKYATTQTQAYHFIEKSGQPKRMGMREMIAGKPQEPKQEAGIRLPDDY